MTFSKEIYDIIMQTMAMRMTTIVAKDFLRAHGHDITTDQIYSARKRIKKKWGKVLHDEGMATASNLAERILATKEARRKLWELANQKQPSMAAVTAARATLDALDAEAYYETQIPKVIMYESAKTVETERLR